MIQNYKMSETVWRRLIENGFITPLRSKQDLTALAEEELEVLVRFQCDEFGGNKLIQVGMNLSWPGKFHYHEAHEQVILMSPVETKPLFMVFAYDRLEEFTRKKEEGLLTEKDFLLVEMVFNHPEYSAFAVNPGVLHGEFTAAGRLPNPSFLVAEPSGLATNEIDLSGVRELFSGSTQEMKEVEA